MKATPVVLALSLIANAALGLALLGGIGRDNAPAARPPFPPPSATAGVSGRPALAEASASAGAASDPVLALRDRLRAVGLSEEEVQAGVRAHVEEPRLARQRELARAAGSGPWWRVASPHPDPTRHLSPELRERLKAERAELTRVLGPTGAVTRAELERYLFLPEDKAARLAALERDYQEMRRDVPAGAAAPQSRSEAEARLKLINEQYERDRAALLTPEELAEVDRRTSLAAWSVALNARYFTASEAEFLQILEITREHRAAAGMDGPSFPGRNSGPEPLQRYTERLIALLGPERYADWNASQSEPYRALQNLQQRFHVPAETVAALKALPKLVGDEGLTIARARRSQEEEQLAALRALAERTREKVRALLGPDVGNAYNDAAARGWLDHLEQGRVPFIQPNGQRAIFGGMRRRLNTPALPPSAKP